MKHLSDDKIQNYLDGNTPQENDAIKNHLKTCIHCQDLLNQYQNLYIDLKRDPEFQLSEAFTHAVMKRLTLTPKRGLLFRIAKDFLLGIGFLWFTAVAIAIAYFIDSKPWEELFKQSTNLMSTIKTTFFVSINHVLSDLIGKPYLLLCAGLTLLIIAIIDRLIIQPKYNNLSL
ncbi:hypothetical protein JW824_00050 [bacterium]|nr:hypothetical protein [bacterium]RQV99532.1 MAG: hypothetical protein EH221_00060 [bacterium]